MKKSKTLIAIITILLILAVITIVITKMNKIKFHFDNPIDTPQFIINIEENRKLYTYFKDNYIVKNNKKIDLRAALENKDINMEDIMKNIKYLTGANDGGSIFFVSKNNNVFNRTIHISKCDSFKENGDNHNYYISPAENYSVCSN